MRNKFSRDTILVRCCRGLPNVNLNDWTYWRRATLFSVATNETFPSRVDVRPGRVHRAAVRTRRAREFDAWLRKCKLRRYSMHLFVNSVIYLTIACLAYVNLVFAARFDR